MYIKQNIKSSKFKCICQHGFDGITCNKRDFSTEICDFEDRDCKSSEICIPKTEDLPQTCSEVYPCDFIDQCTGNSECYSGKIKQYVLCKKYGTVFAL